MHTFQDEHGANILDPTRIPSVTEMIPLIALLKKVLFPGFFGDVCIPRENLPVFLGEYLFEIHQKLSTEIKKAYLAIGKVSKAGKCESLTDTFMDTLPKVRNLLKLDIEAALAGDPAAKSIPEIITSYPCLIVIMIYRLAHELYLLEVPLLPRMMSEWAHSISGVDIHPGARIGHHFFIDHGTGVVIGETTRIGNHVKIYQGVTLGALSFPKNKRGQLLKGLKRHPTIEDQVTIYANATILGGDTIIGKGSVIGGNSWITQTVPPHTKVKT